MQGFATLLLAVGVWIVYCGWSNIGPVSTLRKIIADPSNADDIISSAVTSAATKAAATRPASSGGSFPGVIAKGDAGTVIAFARTQLGKPYVLGGAGPDVWDCSGLTMVAYGKVGVKLPHNALIQMQFGTPITSKAALLPGDLLFPLGSGVVALGDHVQIYTGNGMQIEAPRPGVGVVERNMWGFSGDKVTARRLITSSSSTASKTETGN